MEKVLFDYYCIPVEKVFVRLLSYHSGKGFMQLLLDHSGNGFVRLLLYSTMEKVFVRLLLDHSGKGFIQLLLDHSGNGFVRALDDKNDKEGEKTLHELEKIDDEAQNLKIISSKFRITNWPGSTESTPYRRWFISGRSIRPSTEVSWGERLFETSAVFGTFFWGKSRCAHAKAQNVFCLQERWMKKSKSWSG